ncbi:DegT/DnrJ/EryC1/StrS family aminotransferase [Nocardia sp. NBC_01730]|uniref:DegT/DnrJ/EryC1/StrS family aminotransferase n=1 Tax=Nocardia sp. NBC_01730 TaxID=2975998 RepID=UPI002E15AD6D|nr:DegT/DnrJ/EryC1/StrS family aminotransferase [Nocardia sp. NBC_01730]
MIPPFTAAVPDDEIATVLAAAEQIMRAGRLVLGAHTEVLETTVAVMAGTRYAIAVNSGSTALEIIYKTVDVQGRTVLMPTNTNYATAAAALAAGAQVQLYDAGLYPDLADLERRLTGDVSAVVVVHIGGYITPDLPQIMQLCEAAGVALIEDAAHAHGSTFGDRPAGGFGYAAAFSLFATKVVTTGEGGVITTDDPDLDRLARIYRNQGHDGDGRHVVWGGSWRMTELGAVLGSAQFDHFDRDLIQRRAVIDRYITDLSGIGLEFPVPHGQVSGHKCIALLNYGIERDHLRDKVSAVGVELARGVYEQPLHRQPVFGGLNIGDSFPAANDFADRHICLPLWRGMTDDIVDRVIKIIRTSVAEAGHKLP